MQLQHQVTSTLCMPPAVKALSKSPAQPATPSLTVTQAANELPVQVQGAVVSEPDQPTMVALGTKEKLLPNCKSAAAMSGPPPASTQRYAQVLPHSLLTYPCLQRRERYAVAWEELSTSILLFVVLQRQVSSAQRQMSLPCNGHGSFPRLGLT